MLHLFYEKEENDWVKKCMEYEVEGATHHFLALLPEVPPEVIYFGK